MRYNGTLGGRRGNGRKRDIPAQETSFLVFDLSRLRDRDGHFLDPRMTDNDQLIRQAIRHAIKVGIEVDHDGQPDDDLASDTD